MSSIEKRSRTKVRIKVLFLPSPLWSHHRSTGLCPYRHNPRRRERERALCKNSLVSPDWLGRSKHSFLFWEPWTLTISSHVILWQCINKNRVGKGEAVANRRSVRWVYTVHMVFKDFKKLMYGKRSAVLVCEQSRVGPYEIAMGVGRWGLMLASVVV